MGWCCSAAVARPAALRAASNRCRPAMHLGLTAGPVPSAQEGVGEDAAGRPSPGSSWRPQTQTEIEMKIRQNPAHACVTTCAVRPAPPERPSAMEAMEVREWCCQTAPRACPPLPRPSLPRSTPTRICSALRGARFPILSPTHLSRHRPDSRAANRAATRPGGSPPLPGCVCCPPVARSELKLKFMLISGQPWPPRPVVPTMCAALRRCNYRNCLTVVLALSTPGTPAPALLWTLRQVDNFCQSGQRPEKSAKPHPGPPEVGGTCRSTQSCAA